MNDKEKIKAEIERLIDRKDPNTYLGVSKIEAYKDVLSFIDDLDAKEVDLEKAIDDYIYTHDGRKRLALELDWKYCNLTLKGGDEIIKFAKHFFDLGLKAQKGE